MAGIQQSQNPSGGTLEPMKNTWQIQYSRFFCFPRLTPTSSALRPLPSRCKKTRPFGTWVTSSSMASLHLINDDRAAGIILIVSFQGKVYEEHRISKLIFSWPQVSCLEACPLRGSRAVFASYRDSLDQVQKFAVRFASASDSQTFIDYLKEGLKDVIDVGLTGSKFGSKMTSASELSSAKATYTRHADELNVNPTGNSKPPAECISRLEIINCTLSEEPILAYSSEATCAPLPSSFTALLFESCAKAEEEAAEASKASETFYLNNQVMGCMTNSSFNDMLRTLETVIYELGGDLAL